MVVPLPDRRSVCALKGVRASATVFLYYLVYLYCTLGSGDIAVCTHHKKYFEALYLSYKASQPQYALSGLIGRYLSSYSVHPSVVCALFSHNFAHLRPRPGSPMEDKPAARRPPAGPRIDVAKRRALRTYIHTLQATTAGVTSHPQKRKHVDTRRCLFLIELSAN